MPEGRIFENPPIPQKSRRKFTFYYEESAATYYFFSCCLVDNVFIHLCDRTKFLPVGSEKRFFTFKPARNKDSEDASKYRFPPGRAGPCLWDFNRYQPQ